MAFHIIFATIGVGLPFMMFIAELLYQKTKDQDYVVMAKRWTKAFAVLLGVGIPMVLFLEPNYRYFGLVLWK